jgi:hypothetical protein
MAPHATISVILIALHVFPSVAVSATTMRQSGGDNPPGSPGAETVELDAQATKHLTIEHIRLEPAPAVDHVPSMTAKFDMTNDGSISLAAITFRIAIVKTSRSSRPEALPRVLAGPFTVRTKTVLAPSHVMTFEMQLRNLAEDCNCRALVEIVSARAHAE